MIDPQTAITTRCHPHFLVLVLSNPDTHRRAPLIGQTRAGFFMGSLRRRVHLLVALVPRDGIPGCFLRMMTDPADQVRDWFRGTIATLTATGMTRP